MLGNGVRTLDTVGLDQLPSATMIRPAHEFPDALDEHRPKGAQLEEILEGLVVGLGPGGRLPSERQLAERYGVARMTVRGAVESLITGGLLYRSHGQGTFVAQPRIVQSEALTSFTEDMRRRGLKAGAVPLGREVVPASPLLSGPLQITVGAPVVRIERIRTADSEPIATEVAQLPLERFPGLDVFDLSDTSLYDALRREWGVEVHHADQRVQAVVLRSEEAELLRVEAGQAAFEFVRLTFDASGVPIEHVRSLYRSDRYQVRTHLHRSVFSAEVAAGE